MQDIKKRFEQLSSNTERSNVNELTRNCSEYCYPTGNNINQVVTAGEQKPIARLIDIGIRSNRIFTSGMSSHLIPEGSKFFAYDTADTKLKDNDAVSRYFSEVSSITLNVLNSSNFFTEMTSAINELGYVGTACVLTEPSDSMLVRFKAYHIDNYYIDESAEGNIDTVYFKMQMKSRQVMQMFNKDTDNIPENIVDDEKGEEDYTIIHAIYPRSDKLTGTSVKTKKAVASVYLCEKTNTIIRETGYDTNPFAVGRFYKASNEIYGRSPAAEVLSTLSMLNAMEDTRIRTAQRLANPPWLLSNTGDTKWVSNDQGSLIYYNGSRAGTKPEQVSVKDNPMVTETIINSKNEEVESAFFVGLFNPLQNRRNMSATEVSKRDEIAMTALVPPITRITRELLAPVFLRVYEILQKSGVYPQKPEELGSGKIKINFNSKATLAIKELELMSVRSLVMDTMSLAEANREVLDLINFDEVIRISQEALGVPNSIIKSAYDVKKLRAARAQAQADQQEMENTKDAADIYQKTNTPLEANSGAAEIMAKIGGQRGI